MSLVPLTENEHRFAEAFKQFRKASDQESLMKQWIVDDLPKVIHSNPSTVKFMDTNVIQILGIGSGFGNMDMLIFDVFGNNNQKVNEIVLEPNKVEVEKFKSTIKSLDQYRFVNLECLPETVESYMARNTSRKFHFIHCIHVLYYVKNPAAIIEAAYNCLEEGGMMLIIHAAASHGINHVKNTFGAKLFASPPKYTPNGSQLEKLVHDLGYKYSSDIINAKLDMTECQNPASQNGNLIWDFITHVASFTENASPEIKGAINDVTKSEFCYRNGGKVFMNIDSSVLIIVK